MEIVMLGLSRCNIYLCYAFDACNEHHGSSSYVQAARHMATHGIVEQCSVTDGASLRIDTETSYLADVAYISIWPATGIEQFNMR